MILHNDIWGDTSVTLIEEIGNHQRRKRNDFTSLHLG